MVAESKNSLTLPTTTSMETNENDDIGISKLSKLNINQETFDQKSKPADSNKHTLEDWLDSILDD